MLLGQCLLSVLCTICLEIAMQLQYKSQAHKGNENGIADDFVQSMATQAKCMADASTA